jgi:hypothetical protein
MIGTNLVSSYFERTDAQSIVAIVAYLATGSCKLPIPPAFLM